MDRVSSGSPLGSNPLVKNATAINATLEATEDFQQRKRLGQSNAVKGIGTLVLFKAKADIPAATADSDGNLTPGTGECWLVRYDFMSGKYMKTTSVDSGLVHNLSGNAIAGGDYADRGTPISYGFRFDGQIVVPAEACGMPYGAT